MKNNRLNNYKVLARLELNNKVNTSKAGLTREKLIAGGFDPLAGLNREQRRLYKKLYQ